MSDTFIQYLVNLYDDVPEEMYLTLLGVFCLTFMLVFVFVEKGKRLKIISMVSLVEYIFLLFCSTVIFRKSNIIQSVGFRPLGSLSFLVKWQTMVVAEKLMNIVVFIPVGLLSSIAYGKLRWWQALLLGGFVTITIEILQLFLNRGFAEFDDVFNNILGCMIGFSLHKVIFYCAKFITIRINHLV